jgi:hypothetical protein
MVGIPLSPVVLLFQPTSRRASSAPLLRAAPQACSHEARHCAPESLEHFKHHEFSLSIHARALVLLDGCAHCAINVGNARLEKLLELCEGLGLGQRVIPLLCSERGQSMKSAGTAPIQSVHQPILGTDRLRLPHILYQAVSIEGAQHRRTLYVGTGGKLSPAASVSTSSGTGLRRGVYLTSSFSFFSCVGRLFGSCSGVETRCWGSAPPDAALTVHRAQLINYGAPAGAMLKCRCSSLLMQVLQASACRPVAICKWAPGLRRSRASSPWRHRCG